MSTAVERDREYLRKATEAAIRIGLVATLVYLCIRIVLPFLSPIIWGVILAVAIYPFHVRLTKRLGGRRKTAATLIVLVALALILIPTFLFLESVTQRMIGLAKGLSEGTLTMPAPPESVAEWPLIGEKLHAAWSKAEADLPTFLQNNSTQLKNIGAWGFKSAAGLTIGVLAFAFSVILAGVFMATAKPCTQASEALGRRLAGEGGVELVHISAATIRSVAMGVVGVALIQSLLAAIGFLFASVPGAGLWSLIVLVLAIAQLPTLIVMLPAVIWVFANNESTTVAVIFAIWGGFVGISDNFLKPLLLGRGVKVPMLVILIGAIGGMITMGILGLFIGAVILAVGQQIYMAWARGDQKAEPEPAS